MNIFITTFHSHYDAMRVYSVLSKENMKAKLMPIPRKLSSSCGTCLRFESDTGNEDIINKIISINECEAIYIYENTKYELIYKNN